MSEGKFDISKNPLLARFLRGEDLNKTSLIAQVGALARDKKNENLAFSDLGEKQQQSVRAMAETVTTESAQALFSFSAAIESAASIQAAKKIIVTKGREFMVATLNLSNSSEEVTRFLLKALFFNVVKKNAALNPHREELFNMFLGTTAFTRSSSAATSEGLMD
jgi:hypothetical protein